MKSESGCRELDLSNECSNPYCIKGLVRFTAQEAIRMGRPFSNFTEECQVCYGTFNRTLELGKNEIS